MALEGLRHLSPLVVFAVAMMTILPAPVANSILKKFADQLGSQPSDMVQRFGFSRSGSLWDLSFLLLKGKHRRLADARLTSLGNRYLLLVALQVLAVLFLALLVVVNTQ